MGDYRKRAQLLTITGVWQVHNRDGAGHFAAQPSMIAPLAKKMKSYGLPWTLMNRTHFPESLTDAER